MEIMLVLLSELHIESCLSRRSADRPGLPLPLPLPPSLPLPLQLLLLLLDSSIHLTRLSAA